MSKKSSSKKSAYKPMYKGLPLVDATEDLDIEIRKGDVSISKKKDPANCAAANAAKRILKTEVEVHISRIYVKDNKKWIRYITPESISREITSFDRAEIFEPGEYTFKAPTGVIRLGEYRKSSRNETGKKQKPMRVTMNVRESARNS